MLVKNPVPFGASGWWGCHDFYLFGGLKIRDAKEIPLESNDGCIQTPDAQCKVYLPTFT